MHSINIRIIICGGLICKVLSVTYSKLLRGTYINYNAIEFFRGVAFCSNICKWVLFAVRNVITGLIGVLAGQFLGAIECVKERLANTVIILKA